MVRQILNTLIRAINAWRGIKPLKAGHQKKCSCGKYPDKYCPSAIYINGAGVMSVNSNELVQCGRFQQQLEAAKWVSTDDRPNKD